MKKVLIFLAIVLFFLGGATVWFLNQRPPRVALGDGALFAVELAETGPFDQAQVLHQPFYHSMLGKMPGPVQQLLNWLPLGAKNSGRSYYTYAVDDHALHLWFSCFLDGQPFKFDSSRTEVFLADTEGRLFASYGWANRRSGRYKLSELNCASFSYFPRWDPEIRVVVYRDNTDPEPFPVDLPNPYYQPQPMTNWPVQTIPHTMTRNGTTFELTSLKRQDRPYWNRRFKDFPYQAPFNWSVSLDSREPDGTTNAWHVIRKSMADNYGNHTVQGFHDPRKDGPLPTNLQWKVEMVVCAEGRSSLASNFFWKLPPMTIPEAGTASPIATQETTVGPLQVRIGALAGPGKYVFTNGLLKEIIQQDVRPNQSGSSSSSRGTGTNEIYRSSYTRGNPTLYLCPYGTNISRYYYTCEARDTVTGKRSWLGSYATRPDTPRFEHKWDRYDMVLFDCSKLTNSNPYEFTFGVHIPQTIEFFIPAPSKGNP